MRVNKGLTTTLRVNSHVFASLCTMINMVLLVSPRKVLFASVYAQGTETCEDIDTGACVLMHNQRPDLCSDPMLSKSSCPKYCKLCPVECYHCNGTSEDFSECTTNGTQLCGEGDICMRKEIRSTADGHHEYELSCQSKQFCDGAGLSMAFGRRSIESRDLHLLCCATDLCNIPPHQTIGTPAPTTKPTKPSATNATGCRRDIHVVVDDTKRNDEHQYNINRFLLQIVNTSHIGHSGSRMALAKFADSIQPLWNLSTYTDTASLSKAIFNTHFLKTNDHNNADLDNALKYLISQKTKQDNRKHVDDVAIIITSHDAQNQAHDHTLATRLHHLYSNVIIIGFNHDVSNGDLTTISTNAAHEFKISHLQNLSKIAHRVQSLICA